MSGGKNEGPDVELGRFASLIGPVFFASLVVFVSIILFESSLMLCVAVLK